MKKNYKKKNKIKKLQKENQSMSTSIDESNARWKQNLLANASEIWKQKISIFDWVYGQSSKNKDDTHLKTIENEHKKEEKEDDEEEFFHIKQPRRQIISEIDDIDSSVIAFSNMKLDDWKDETVCQSIRNRFVTGDWIAAKKFQSEVEKRAHNLQPDLFDEQVQNDKKSFRRIRGKNCCRSSRCTC